MSAFGRYKATRGSGRRVRVAAVKAGKVLRCYRNQGRACPDRAMVGLRAKRGYPPSMRQGSLAGAELTAGSFGPVAGLGRKRGPIRRALGYRKQR